MKQWLTDSSMKKRSAKEININNVCFTIINKQNPSLKYYYKQQSIDGSILIWPLKRYNLSKPKLSTKFLKFLFLFRASKSY